MKNLDIVLKPNKSYRWVNGTLEHDLLDIDKYKPQISTVNNSNSPLELFELFFDTDVIQMFVDCTNKYASSKNRKADVTVPEMKTFFGILLLSGYHPYPRRRMY